MNDQYESVEFEDGEFKLDVSVSPNERTVWLSADQMSLLFGRNRTVIQRHIRNIFKEKELTETSVSAKFAHTATDGKTYDVVYYNLDAIISVGYRVKSKRGVIFRQWATSVLNQFLMKGYVLSPTRASSTEDNYLCFANEVIALDRRVTKLEEKEEAITKDMIFFEGQVYDAFSFISSLASRARKSIVLIDPYADGRALDYLVSKKRGVSLDVYRSSRAALNEAAILRFNEQYGGLRDHVLDSFHDRFLILDQRECYSIGASLNHAGRKAFGIHKIGDDDIIDTILNKLVFSSSLNKAS